MPFSSLRPAAVSAAAFAILLVSSLGFWSAANADEAVLVSDAPWLAVKAARMLDVETGEMLSPAVVLVHDGRIEAVNPPSLPPGVPELDLGDLTLLPGLMDMHTHLLFSLDEGWVHRAVTETDADAALRGAKNARTTLMAGFTTVRDVGARSFADVALMKAIERGDVIGPRMFPAGHSVGSTGGHCDTTGYRPGVAERGPEEGVADGVDEIVKAVRSQIKHGAKVIKTCATAGVLSFEGPVGAQQYSQEELDALVAEASLHGIKVAAHAHGPEGILAAVRAGVSSIEHGSTLTDEIIAAMKEKGTYLVPTTYLADAIDLDSLHPHLRAKAELILPVAKDSLRTAIQEGVKIAFGTDAAVYPHGLNAREFGTLVERGMTPLEAIRTATVNAADLLGVEDRGVIASGNLADLVAVTGDPLEDVTVLETVAFVMKGGEVFKAPESTVARESSAEAAESGGESSETEPALGAGAAASAGGFDAAAGSEGDEDARRASAALKSLLDEAWEQGLREDPIFATRIGDHRYNDRLPGATPVDFERRLVQERDYLRRLQAIDREVLREADALTYDVYARLTRDAIKEYELKAYLAPVTDRAGFHIDFASLPDWTPFATTEDYRAYLKRLEAFGSYANDNLVLLKAGLQFDWTWPQVVLEGVDVSVEVHLEGDAEDTVFFEPFQRFPKAVPEGEREALRQRARKAIEEVVRPAYREFLTFIQEEYRPAARTAIGASELPRGREFYAHRVRMFTTLDTTPEEVHEKGLAEVARIRTEMEAIIRETGFEGTFDEFLEFLRTDPRFYVETPEALMKEASRIAKRMDGELPRLFKTLPRTPYGVREVPDFLAPNTYPAYYEQPAGDGSRAGTYFVNTYNLPSRPLYELEALSLHEAVPGHHLQLALQQELGELHPFRRFAGFSAFVEGWALYAERLGLEVGFYEDPYSNFGRLTYEMWRACRLVVDTGMHALGWSRQQAIDFMAANTGLSLHNITTEIDRYIGWPGQALAYKMGELKIRELRAQAEEALGPAFDLREFHDVLLNDGSIPLSLLETKVEAYVHKVAAAANSRNSSEEVE